MKRSLLQILLAGLIGLIAWSGELWTLPLSLAFPLLWAASRNRIQAGLIALAYYLAASRGLPVGAATFFESHLTVGMGLWLLAGVALSLVWFAAWSKSYQRRAFMIPVVLLIISVPPFGIVGWCNPLTAAGVIFPGLGWIGLAMTVVLVVLTALLPVLARLPVLLSLSLLSPYVNASVVANTTDWIGVNTRYSFTTGNRDFLQDFFRQQEMIGIANSSTNPVSVFPESSAGLWHSASEHLWTSNLRSQGKHIVLGAELPSGNGYENSMIEISEAGAKVVYRQRMPVPVSMWKPWADDGVKAYWFSYPTFEVAGKTVAGLICYEQFLVWPVLQSMFYRPEALIATANVWWAKDTSIPAIQKASVAAWASLFDVPTVLAFNE